MSRSKQNQATRGDNATGSCFFALDQVRLIDKGAHVSYKPYSQSISGVLMQSRIISFVVVVLASLLSASHSVAAESNAGAAAQTKVTPKATAKPAKGSAKVKLVDINSASKTELMKLPGIGAAEADKIIAGRPYLTKAHLVTHQALPAWIYEGIKGRIMAKPNKATEAKLKEMEKQR